MLDQGTCCTENLLAQLATRENTGAIRRKFKCNEANALHERCKSTYSDHDEGASANRQRLADLLLLKRPVGNGNRHNTWELRSNRALEHVMSDECFVDLIMLQREHTRTRQGQRASARMRGTAGSAELFVASAQYCLQAV